MATRDDITDRVMNLLGTTDHLSETEVESMIQTRYEALYESILWSGRLRDFMVGLHAPVESTSSDTVTVTNGSATVTSIGTPFTSSHIGRQIRIGDHQQYFFVNNVTGNNTLVLGDGSAQTVSWPDDSESGLSWTIFQTVYTLGSDCDGIYSFASDLEIDELDGGRGMLDRMDANRMTTAPYPHYWMYAGYHHTSGLRQIEVWPVPSQSSALRGQMIRKAPTLSDSSIIDISVPLLTFCSVADCAGMLFSKTGDESWGNLQLFYERKANELEESVHLKELERLSLPRSIGRLPRTRNRYIGTDYEVSHHVDSL